MTNNKNIQRKLKILLIKFDLVDIDISNTKIYLLKPQGVKYVWNKIY